MPVGIERMEDKLVQITLFMLRASDPSSVEEVICVIGNPVAESDHRASVALKILRDGDVFFENSAFGFDEWQALMLGISILRLSLSHVLHESSGERLYRSRNDAITKTDGNTLDDIFTIVLEEQ